MISAVGSPGTVSPAAVGSKTGKVRERTHPIESAPYCRAEQGRTPASTAKGRKLLATGARIDLWANRAVNLIKQLWKGTLSDELMTSGPVQDKDGYHWPNVQETPEGSLITKQVREKIAIAVNARPQGFPQGEDALRRHQGVELSRHPTKNNEKSSQAVPKRGDIWPAVIEDIALPPAGTDSTYVGKVSPVADDYLRNFTTKMLRTSSEIDALREVHLQEDTVPYVDANIQAGMLILAVRMAMSGMLRGIKRAVSTVGLFTVVKKVEETGRIMLRLVFDQRVPNQYWKDPLWTPLAGPGAFSAIDLSEDSETGWDSYIIKGDIPDCFYRWGIPLEMAEWFALPNLTFEEVEKELERQGEFETIKLLKGNHSSEELTALGLTVAAMGWSWAVFLAQEGIISIVQNAGAELMKKYGLEKNPFEAATAMVEGGPPPVVQEIYPLHFEYIDDFGLIHFFKGGESRIPMVDAFYEAIKDQMKLAGLPVHKETVESESVMLGVSLGGSPPTVRTVPEKRWMAVEVQWELARAGRGLSKTVESIIALTTWIFMVMREGLSIYQETYRWVRENRLTSGFLVLPKEVRRELAAAAVAVLMVGQDLTMKWCSKVYLFDASGVSGSVSMPLGGGGVCETMATKEEVVAEGKWAVRGGWTKYVGDPDFYNHYRPDEPSPKEIKLKKQGSRKDGKGGIPIRDCRFLLLFGGQEEDLGFVWQLMRQGAEVGLRVIVDCYDLVYGSEFDLSDPNVLLPLLAACSEGKYQGAHSFPPRSTWTLARRTTKPGSSSHGWEKVRQDESHYGSTTSKAATQDYVAIHSALWKASLEIMLAVSESGGCTSTEHVSLAGSTKGWYGDSGWVWPQVRAMQKHRGWVLTRFAKCLWGSSKCQTNAIAGDLKGMRELDIYGTPKCIHPKPLSKLGKRSPGSKGGRGDQNPEAFCRFLASCVIKTWVANPVPVRVPEPTVKSPTLGERVPSPEVSGAWDPIERWTETARWVWSKEEHNNIWEARAGVVSAKIASMDVGNWNKRMIVISDSQVTIGVFGKGRSSTLVLNLLARRMAALTMATGMKFYWRYMRTHRNHADGPSRGYPIGHAPPDGADEDKGHSVPADSKWMTSMKTFSQLEQHLRDRA